LVALVTKAWIVIVGLLARIPDRILMLSLFGSPMTTVTPIFTMSLSDLESSPLQCITLFDHILNATLSESHSLLSQAATCSGTIPLVAC
jgi:hypothetical protein